MNPLASRLGATGMRTLLGLMRRQAAEARSQVAQPTASYDAYDAAVRALAARLRGLGGAHELALAYHFDRGTLVRWADAAVGHAGLAPAVALDAAVWWRLRELGEVGAEGPGP